MGITEVKNRHSGELLRQPGVSGVGTEKDEAGNDVISVYLNTDDPEIRRRLPQQIEGYPVKFIFSGPFRKLSSG